MAGKARKLLLISISILFLVLLCACNGNKGTTDKAGAGTALVGNPDQVAARMKEYADLGIETFVLSGYPHLEEAYRTAELLFPKLPIKQETKSTEACCR